MAVYDALLHLLPPEFRERFGAEMALDFNDALAVTRTLRARMAVTLLAVSDVVQTAVTQWLRDDALRVTSATMGVLTALWLPVILLAMRQWPDGPSLLPLFAEVSCLALPLVHLVVARRRRRGQTASCARG